MLAILVSMSNNILRVWLFTKRKLHSKYDVMRENKQICTCNAFRVIDYTQVKEVLKYNGYRKHLSQCLVHANSI